MTTILLMLLFPIGALFYRYERKNRHKYQAVFDDYIEKIDNSPDFTKAQKLERIQELFIANRYEIVEKGEDNIIAERKILSMGLLMMFLIFYLFYFFFFQKPHRIEYQLK
jgi:cbb3-type cytochrome oxidase subunit 3